MPVQALKKTGANVNVTNEAGRTLAHVAADYNHVAILKYLHAQGANLNVRYGTPLTGLLLTAARAGAGQGQARHHAASVRRLGGSQGGRRVPLVGRRRCGPAGAQVGGAGSLQRPADRKGTTPDGQTYYDAAESAEIKALLKGCAAAHCASRPACMLTIFFFGPLVS